MSRWHDERHAVYLEFIGYVIPAVRSLWPSTSASVLRPSVSTSPARTEKLSSGPLRVLAQESVVHDPTPGIAIVKQLLADPPSDG